MASGNFSATKVPNPKKKKKSEFTATKSGGSLVSQAKNADLKKAPNGMPGAKSKTVSRLDKDSPEALKAKTTAIKERLAKVKAKASSSAASVASGEASPGNALTEEQKKRLTGVSTRSAARQDKLENKLESVKAGTHVGPRAAAKAAGKDPIERGAGGTSTGDFKASKSDNARKSKLYATAKLRKAKKMASRS